MSKTLAIIFGILAALAITGTIIFIVMYRKQKGLNEGKLVLNPVTGKAENAETTVAGQRVRITNINNTSGKCPAGTREVKNADGTFSCVKIAA